MVAGAVICAVRARPGPAEDPVPPHRRLFFAAIGWTMRKGGPPSAACSAPRGRRAARRRAPPAELPAPRDAALGALAIDPLELAIGFGLVPLVDEGAGGSLLSRVGAIRRQIAAELGMVIPPVRIHDDIALDSHEYVVKVRGAEVARGAPAPRPPAGDGPGRRGRPARRRPDDRARVRPARRVDRRGEPRPRPRRSATPSSTASRSSSPTSRRRSARTPPTCSRVRRRASCSTGSRNTTQLSLRRLCPTFCP